MRKLLNFFNGLLLRDVPPIGAKEYVKNYLHDLRRAPVYDVAEIPPMQADSVTYDTQETTKHPLHTLNTIYPKGRAFWVRYRVDTELAVRTIRVIADSKPLAWSYVVERHANSGEMVQTLISIQEVSE